MILLLLACTGPTPAPESGTPDDTPVDTDTPTDTDTTPTGPFTLTIPANPSSEGHERAADCPYQLDVAYECANPNPEVRWENPPAGTVAFALVFDDPDAGDWDHWAVVNLPADASTIAEAASGTGATTTIPAGAYELENGAGSVGYYGSCPGSAHRYRWRLWALSAPLDGDLTRFNQVENQVEDVALGLAETCHVYGPRSGS